ncbi:1,2-dihydroxy-3-keto-5-methylthiopentene dioxygenase [Streptomyces violens]|uniref:1,2-dihydroxy-3-keto-5-methylthiopentene dioxygenase n=1 Tax=Streptomyces violens TaxID=66377 RepID=UPI0004BEE0F3|nr:cupin [Streptomyces violens]
MTLLQIMPEDAPETVQLRTEDLDVIREKLLRIGVRFERWHATHRLPAGADDSTIMRAYRSHIAHTRTEGGYGFVDIVHMGPTPAHPDRPRKTRAARKKFLAEHFHDDDVVRFFVTGTGCFYLHVAGRVHAVVCTAGDLLSVPSRTVHWFDMGERPDFTAIRFFQKEDGWVCRFLPDSISARFPTLDDLLVTT